jgi:hypothetical protein
MAGSDEHGMAKGGEFLEQLNNNQLLKRPAPYS